ncbi:hypothetical protein F4804DRAFT_314976 [Jackrogersella minutella]|nr:hypothetical protein F4804DRAFT_314976 [Jackrogersella minutella]
MNWHRHSTVIATAEPVAVKPEGTGKKLRRKLQKIGTQQRWYRSSDHNDAKKAVTTTTANNTNTKKVTISNPIPKVVPETPKAVPDPDDGRWLEQLRKSGYLCRTQPLVPPNHKPHRHSMQVIPEFAHLTVNEAKSGRQLDKRASCITPSSTASISRRYAKTPVHHIGQLENHSKRNDEIAARRKSSIEKIADSYRALLESSCAILDDDTHEPTSPLRLEGPYHTGANNYGTQDSIHEIPDASSAMGSHSDDGTLVAFEEDPVAFNHKPASFSPEPPSPRSLHQQRPRAVPNPPPRRASPGSHSLQICLDLLGRELSSAASGSSLRPSGETSALQMWVMIEAYERLRDKIYDMRLDRDQERSLNSMLDMWIKALYSVYDEMTGNGGHESESDYDD